jgi:hypothetical protein
VQDDEPAHQSQWSNDAERERYSRLGHRNLLPIGALYFLIGLAAVCRSTLC